MSMIYDNWERLMAAVVKREEFRQLCHEHSRSTSICSDYSSDFSASFRSSDVNLQDVEESVSQLVFVGGHNSSFRPSDILMSKRLELGKGTFGTTIITELLQDVQVSDHEFLATGTKVVMKLLNAVKSTKEEFKQQMKVLGSYKHENVSVPRAYYSSDKANGKLIVYDFHRHGSVFDKLHGERGPPSWESRLKIAIGAARGIAHIHAQSGAHGNIKSSNIFLNSEQYGVVSDFDLSRIMVRPPYRGALGFGYQFPIYDFRAGPHENDVYSFGNLLLELLTGKSPLQPHGFKKDKHLVEWARSIESERWTSKLFDQTLKKQITYEKDVLEMMQTEIPGVRLPVKDSVMDWETVRATLGAHFHSMTDVPTNYFPAQNYLEMTEMFEVAMRCLSMLPKDRPKMSDVVLMIENIGKLETVLPKLWYNHRIIYNYVLRPVSHLVFLGGFIPSFRLEDTLKFDQELGKGTFGTTILAQLLQCVRVPDKEYITKGTKVVTKLLNEVKSTQEEFKQQMKIIGSCRHENVSAPRTYYFSNYKVNRTVVVYDYHSQGSLSDMLHGDKYSPYWYSRLEIAIGAARGIAHIHTQLNGKLAHGNIKSSNIFLNSQKYGCVSDFGLSGVMVNTSCTSAFDSVSQDSDVYSFGIILLELVTGKSPMELHGFDKDMGLVAWARSIKPEDWTTKLFDQTLRIPIRYKKDVLEMMETEEVPGVCLPVTDWEALRGILVTHFRSKGRELADYFPAKYCLEMTEMFEVAMRCLALVPKDRPNMCDVVLMLENIKKPKQDLKSDKERVRSRILRL